VLQYPISFALNLAIPTDKVIGAKQVYCAPATSPSQAGASATSPAEPVDSLVKADEADVDQLKVGGAQWRSYIVSIYSC